MEVALYCEIEIPAIYSSLSGSAKIAPFSSEFRDPLESFKKKFI